MAKNTLTFELGGRVGLEEFSEGINAFRGLINALTPKDLKVTWVIDDLQPGSAIATFRGEAENMVDVEDIVELYGNVGYALAKKEELSKHGEWQYNGKVSKAAQRIGNLAETVEYVRFETPDVDHLIYGNGSAIHVPPPSTSIGSINGRVQTLSNRSGLRFNLFDAVFDKAVACYLQPDQEESMREIWGRRVEVTGTISRQALTGRPMSIRQILKITPLGEVEPGSYRNARGAVPWEEGQKLPEQVIRELRDAW